MAYRNFADPALSRRSIFRGGAYAVAGASLVSLPFGRELLAHGVDESWPNVAALARKYVDEKKVAQMYLTFGWGQEDHAHHVGGGTLGFDSTVGVDENSLYRIYSMTKPITGMAAMILIDEGKLGLDQPIHEFLPKFKDMQVLADAEGALEDTVPAEREITIRHLLTHTAGFDYVLATASTPLLKAYGERGVLGGQASKFPNPLLPYAPADGLEAMVDNLAELPLRLQPGERFHYSISIDVLGRVIEIASGQTLEEFFKARFFEPLGMNSTFFKVPESEMGRLTTNYFIQNGFPIPIDSAASSIYAEGPPILWGGAGLVCSPKDYDRFQRMLLGYGKLGEERIMSEAAVRLGVSDLFPEGVDLKGTWMEGQGHGAGGRSVNGTYGWGGAAGTLSAIDYKLGLRACLFTQHMPSNAFPIREEYLAALEADTAALRTKKAA